MKRLVLVAIIFSLFSTGSNSVSCFAAEQKMLLPESLEALSQMAADKKTVTIFIEEEDPKRATELLNTSNKEYAKKGWELFNITPYNYDGDFKGFFITYQKKLIIL
jgi:hypothetical protein